jgi:hypothetical protein
MSMRVIDTVAHAPRSISRKASLIACALPAIYFFAGAAFALVYFQDYASDTPQFLRYVVAPLLIGAFIMVLGLLLSSTKALVVGLTAISVLIGLFAFEALMTVRVVAILLGFFGATDPTVSAQSYAQAGLPTGFTVKRLNRHLETKELRNAILGGVPGSDVLLCWQGSTPVRYTADRYGYNNPDEVYRDEITALIVGDSFIEGMCQSPGKDIASQLREEIPETVSLGTRGAGPLFGLAALGRFGKEMHPQHVIIAFFEGNDWENLSGELKIPWLKSALLPEADFGPANPSPELLQKSRELNAKVRDSTVPAFAILTKTRIVRNFLALNQTSTQLGLTYPKTTENKPEYRVVLARAKELTESWNGKVTLLYIPQSVRYIGLFPRDFIYDKLRTRVIKQAKDQGIEVIDLVEAFRSESNPARFYAADAHFSDEGAAYAANAIKKQILSAGKSSLVNSAGSQSQ